MIRSFIALKLSREIHQNLAILIENLKKGALFTSSRPVWVRPESIHLTLKFLGNIDENMTLPVTKIIQKAADETAPFTIRIRDLGVFPDERRPRTLWCGMTKGAEQTATLQKKIDLGLEPLGFEREKRPFHPHLTLARIKSLKGTAALMNVIKSNREKSRIGECLIDRVILFRSELHPDGARYSKLYEAEFKG